MRLPRRYASRGPLFSVFAASILFFSAFPACGEAPFTVRIIEATPQWKNSLSVYVALANRRPLPPGILLDRSHSPQEEFRRPASVVTFNIVDAAGRRIPFDEAAYIEGTPELVAPKDILLLGPDELFGWRITLGANPVYPYHLKPGRYRIRATVCIPLGAFVAELPEFGKALEALHGTFASPGAPILTQGCVESNTMLVTLPASRNAPKP